MSLTNGLISLRFLLVSLELDPSDLLREMRFLEQWSWGFALVKKHFSDDKVASNSKDEVGVNDGVGAALS
jgi:hypothetical protein